MPQSLLPNHLRIMKHNSLTIAYIPPPMTVRHIGQNSPILQFSDNMSTAEMNYEQPLFSVVNLLIGDQDASITVMYRGVRFHVSVEVEDLRGSTLESQFRQFRQTIDDDGEALESFENWLVSPCYQFLRDNTPSSRPESVTLQQFYDPVTYVFRLENENGTLRAIAVAYNPEELRYISPMVPKVAPVVLSAINQGIAVFPATDLEIIRAPGAWGDELDQVPRVVRSRSTNSIYAFKAAVEGGSFRRELQSLLDIQRHDPSGKLRTSRISGLVLWDNADFIMGLLIQYIPHRGTLDEETGTASCGEKEKWVGQIDETVKRLHAMDIAWGDVKHSNVLINEAGDAVVIDFGGGCTEGCVDESVEGTREGDAQGLTRMRDFLREGV